MRKTYFQRGPDALRNPLARALTVAGVGLVVIAAFFLGLAVLAVLLGLATLASIGLAARTWWLRRRMRKSAPKSRILIEGEYTVIEDPRRRPPDRE